MWWRTWSLTQAQVRGPSTCWLAAAPKASEDRANPHANGALAGQITTLEVGPRGDIWAGILNGDVVRYFYETDPYFPVGVTPQPVPREKYLFFQLVSLASRMGVLLQ